ncbi:uncharacterized protein LOC127864010 [Dreissena polymorpha]|uniref:Uncharacterized protein n=1 Tax=Dreissena polymorpha TaxID=45954 RepID=A0A9D3XYP5_DREPO|nr:uncharacterized protein LOC127864010 [Dreissena polymorpha]KAH3689766.1 hypothetical protein DPMN_191459 [Dreissena polymorpha]
MDLEIQCMIVILGLFATAQVCSGVGVCFRCDRDRLAPTSGASSSRDGLVGGLVALGVAVVAFLVLLIICCLKKKGKICDPRKLKTKRNATVNTVETGINQTNYSTTASTIRPPPPKYTEVDSSVRYENKPASTMDPAYPAP